MNTRTPSLIVCIFAFLLTTLCFAQTDEKKGKVVRVGWFDSAFNHIDKKGRRTGYAYEYQCRIAANTGWTFEYVEGSWTELFEMLKRGEIDLLSDVSYTPEREQQMLFSNMEMGKEEYFVNATVIDSTMSPGTAGCLEGKRIAVNKSSVQLDLLKKWMTQFKVQAQIVEITESERACLQMIKTGKVDAVASTTSFNEISHDFTIPIARIGSENIFFAINKNRPDLKNELDKAMSKIRNHNPYYVHDLHEKFFFHANISKYLPANEAEWLRRHGAIRIGYRDNYLPFCAQDSETGKVIGLLKDFIDIVSGTLKNVDVTIEAIPYSTINDAIDATLRGEVDVAFPNGMSVYDAEISNLMANDAFVKSAEMAIIRNNDNFHADGKVRAAINASNPNYLSLINEQYPNWELVNFNSTYECLEGVASDKADLLLASSYRMGVLNPDIKKLGLKAVATGAMVPLRFSTSKGNTELFSIMSRLTHMMSESEIHASLAKYSEVRKQTSFSEFFKDNIGFAIVFLVLLSAVFYFLLRRSQREHHRAEAASLAKTRFLFSMSHDIRTPMNAIIGYTNLMKENINDKTKCDDYLSKVQSASEFLLGLINNVLEMARIESGKVELNEKPWPLGRLLVNVKTLYTDLATEKGLSLSLEQHLTTKAVYADNIRLSEVFLNLLSNAYKYTPKGGSIKLTSVELPCEKEGYTTIKSVVEDNGQGMSPEYLPHVFEDFTREQTTTQNKIGGSGLGMSIVKKLVELMGGTITVESELGKGTKFTVIISHRIADESLLHDATEQHADSDNFAGRRVLLVEDNELNAEIATEILQAVGLEVDHAEDGLVCIDKLTQAPAHTYDIILMDIQMPNLNGYDTTRRIRAFDDEDKANIPIIAMTANAFKRDREDAKKAGMNAHLGKPIEVPKLLETLKEYL